MFRKKVGPLKTKRPESQRHAESQHPDLPDRMSVGVERKAAGFRKPESLKARGMQNCSIQIIPATIMDVRGCVVCVGQNATCTCTCNESAQAGTGRQAGRFAERRQHERKKALPKVAVALQDTGEQGGLGHAALFAPESGKAKHLGYCVDGREGFSSDLVSCI